MDIMLTIGYSLKIPRDKFFNSENGYVKEEIKKAVGKTISGGNPAMFWLCVGIGG